MSENIKAQARCFRSNKCRCSHYADCIQHPTPKPLTLAVPQTLDECRSDQIENWWAAYVSSKGG